MFVDKKQKINKIEIGNHKINYGFLNRKDNNSLFINISSWVKVINDSDKDFNKEMNLILKSIKQLIYNYNDSFYDNKKTIVSLDIRKNGFTYNTKSYLNIEITLFTNNENIHFVPDDKLNNKILDLVNNILDTKLKDSSDFKFTLKK